jgi:restriction endonuclease S subunit
MKSRYRKLGSLIEKVDIRNIENISYDLMGVKITKEFMPSVANINGTDMKKYKLVYEGMFAANLMHVDRDKIIPVALWQDPNPVLISPAYDVFKIIDDVELLPEYLMICFRRSDFDRNGWFLSGSSIRGNLTWDKFCDIEIPMVDIDIQKAIVKHYNLLNKQTQQLRDLISSYRNFGVNHLKSSFVDRGIDPLTVEYDKLDNTIMINQLESIACRIRAGGTPSRDINDFWLNGTIPWLKIGEINNSFVFDSEEQITEEGLLNSSAKIVEADTLLLSMYCVSEEPNIAINKMKTTTNQAICAIEVDDYNLLSYLFFYFLAYSRRMLRKANGSVQTNLNKGIIQRFKILEISKRKNYVIYRSLLQQIELLELRIKSLNEMKTLLISKMG